MKTAIPLIDFFSIVAIIYACFLLKFAVNTSSPRLQSRKIFRSIKNIYARRKTDYQAYYVFLWCNKCYIEFRVMLIAGEFRLAFISLSVINTNNQKSIISRLYSQLGPVLLLSKMINFFVHAPFISNSIQTYPRSWFANTSSCNIF